MGARVVHRLDYAPNSAKGRGPHVKSEGSAMTDDSRLSPSEAEGARYARELEGDVVDEQRPEQGEQVHPGPDIEQRRRIPVRTL